MYIGFLWENQKEKRSLKRPRHRWESNIKIHLREIGTDSIDLAQDRDQWMALLNTVTDLWVP
jgi:hypothetical protein